MNFFCEVCSSRCVITLNTYKHYAVVCNDCGSVTHKNKIKYLFEYVVPRSFAKKILPKKAFLRLFSDQGEFEPSEFYAYDSFDATTDLEWRKSEVNQFLDQMKLCGIKIDATLRFLDISGGPGLIGNAIKSLGANVVVTEYSSAAVSKMSEQLGLDCYTFDYSKNKINEIVPGIFDIILIRSSIIFCKDLDCFISDLVKIIKPSGMIYIESILPSLGEIYWWQQLEYKFPIIYSQLAIENSFRKQGFKMIYGARDYGSYYGVKYRSYNSIDRHIFTWLIEYPMILFYRLINLRNHSAIDQSMSHKMITQMWSLDAKENVKYNDFIQGRDGKSKTFGYCYNNYLKPTSRDIKKY
jgi:SAM-dependent methyltransferase